MDVGIKSVSDGFLKLCQILCMLIEFFVTMCFVMRYYIAVLHDTNTSNNLQKIFDFDYNKELEKIYFILPWLKTINSITDKKQTSSLNIRLICILFSHVAVLILTIGIIFNIDFMLRTGMMIAVFSQFIFGFTIYNYLVSILHNSIYQLSQKQIQYLRTINIASIIFSLPALSYLATDNDDGSNINYIFLIITELPLFISQTAFVSMILRLYYVKLGKIINDFQKYTAQSITTDINSQQWKELTKQAQYQILDKLVQSMILNLLFVIIAILEMIVVIYTNYQQYKESVLLIFGSVTMTLAMLGLTCINSLQAPFNIQLYQKLCKQWHNCCVKCMQGCIFRIKE